MSIERYGPISKYSIKSNIMKAVLSTILFAILLLKGYGQSDGCNCSFDKIISLSGGTPFNLNMEGGLMWKQAGAEIGIKSYSVYNTIKGKPVETALHLAPYTRGLISLLSAGDFHSYLTAYYGYQIMGASLRLGWAVSDNLMINAESAITKESGEEFNAGITIRL